MKRNLFVLGEGMLLIFLLSLNAGAQDVKNVNPMMSQVLADTTFLRAAIVTLEPGQKTDMHTHPAHFVYALSEGRMKVNFKDGTMETYDMKPGMALVGAPERPHITENTGTSTIKFLIVELKEHPYTAEK